MLPVKNLIHKFLSIFITDSERTKEITGTREIATLENREIKRPITDSFSCPYCQSKNFVRRGLRLKKRESVQLYICKDCGKTFTPHSVRGKHYPLSTIFDAISLYNLGYSLEESCRKTNSAVSGSATAVRNKIGTGAGDISLSAATLSSWLTEFKDDLPFLRMRDFAINKFKPKEMVVTATLAHRQLYRYRFHRAKGALVMQENFHHRSFTPLVEFLEMVPGECPHQYFSQGERASETPLAFSKTAMIVRGKTNYATKLAAFVLQGAKERKNRHEILQKFMLYNDSVTVATEVPVYLTRDDLEHMKTQLGFQIYNKVPLPKSPEIESISLPKTDATIAEADIADVAKDLPKLITGHIDILQIRNGMIHLLDFKPGAEKERPIEQLTLYAMALSRLTGLRLFEFKCAWFEEKDYFEFYPLHVLPKTKKASRRWKIYTMEGAYAVNKNESKIERIRPL